MDGHGDTSHILLQFSYFVVYIHVCVCRIQSVHTHTALYAHGVTGPPTFRMFLPGHRRGNLLPSEWITVIPCQLASPVQGNWACAPHSSVKQYDIPSPTEQNNTEISSPPCTTTEIALLRMNAARRHIGPKFHKPVRKLLGLQFSRSPDKGTGCVNVVIVMFWVSFLNFYIITIVIEHIRS